MNKARIDFLREQNDCGLLPIDKGFAGELGVRGFNIVFQEKTRTLSLPSSGCGLYTGEQAVEVMELYCNKGFNPIAKTVNSSMVNGVETLTFKEMKTLYPTS